YGGAAVGIMGALADAALAAGGDVIGVIPDGLFSREVPHKNLTEQHVVADMHARKALMYRLADGFIALPGGYGTLDELFEATTWNYLRLHEPRKPITLLDDDGFWDPLVALVDSMTDAGFVKPSARRILQRASSPAEAIKALRTFEFDD
ncbi:MAG TPA: TIGR00730 family Rossman fold protein, partial [Acidimicrobiales bacterium]